MLERIGGAINVGLLRLSEKEEFTSKREIDRGSASAVG